MIYVSSWPHNYSVNSLLLKVEIKPPELKRTEPHLEQYKIIQSPLIFKKCSKHAKTFEYRLYIRSVFNIPYTTCATGTFCACIFTVSTDTMCVKGLGVGDLYVCVCARAHVCLTLNHKLNMSSPGSFWSFWPFSTSARTKERKDKKEMFRISMVLGLFSHCRGKAQLLFSIMWPFRGICGDVFTSRYWAF